MMRGARTPIEQVLELIDAQPIPDADELAQMSVPEIEQQLAELGVDMDAELGELFGQLESPPMEPLASLSASDVEQLSLARVEHRLESEGVDVREWLSRAEALIRNARVRQPLDEALVGPAKTPSRGSCGQARRPVLSRAGGRSRRRVPQALAASIVMVAIAGVTFSLFDEPALDVGSPRLSGEVLAPAPATSASDVVQGQSLKRDLKPVDELFEESRKDAMQDTLVPMVEAPRVAANEPRPAARMIPPSAPTSATAARANSAANAVAQHGAETMATAESVRPDIATLAPTPPRESAEQRRAKQSRDEGVMKRARSAVSSGASSPRASAVLPKEKKIAEAAASAEVVRQQHLKASAKNEADEESTMVHSLRAGQALAVSLTGVRLREDDRKALLGLFSDVDLSSGANLRLTMLDGIVQVADVEFPQGRSISAVRDSQGNLVLKR